MWRSGDCVQPPSLSGGLSDGSTVSRRLPSPLPCLREDPDFIISPGCG